MSDRPCEGIATDASHTIKNCSTRYKGIDLRTGNEIFLECLGNLTVNIGEFIGVVSAAKYIIEHDYAPRIIYTDSLTAIAWFRQKRTASKRKLPTLIKAEVFLQAMSCMINTIKVLHWYKDKWGEIPADFGLK